MKAQVSILIILGVFIIIIFLGGMFIMMSNNESQLKEEVEQVRGLGTDAEQIINYANSCFENIITEGLFLMGSQGGYIYRSQGGRSFDYDASTEGTFFVNVDNKQVPYRIANPVGVMQCSSTLPDYPLTTSLFTYPYTDSNFINKQYEYTGCFGKAIRFDTKRSLEDIRHYIVNHIDECDFSSFRNFDFRLGQADANVEFSRDKTIVEVLYPMTITNVNTNAKGEISKFRIDIKLALDKLFDIANDMITNDISDPNYDIDDLRNDEVVVYVDRDIHSKDDLIKVNSRDIKLNGKEFELKFMRRNRPPALEYVHDTKFNECTLNEWKSGACSLGPSIEKNDIINQDIEAVDPDEDAIEIVVTTNTNANKIELYKKTINIDGVPAETPPISFSNFAPYSQIPIKVYVTDGEFEDYQTTNIEGDFIIE